MLLLLEQPERASDDTVASRRNLERERFESFESLHTVSPIEFRLVEGLAEFAEDVPIMRQGE